jgi:ElaB/YqjD/DUF883 family membrane-anchored ribosome-binding protein
MNGRNQENEIRDAAEQATNVVGDTAQKLKGIAADAGSAAQDYVRDASSRATEIARETGRQATAAAQTAYSQGNEMLDVVEGMVRENVWAGLLIAAAAGYGLACLVKTRR